MRHSPATALVALLVVAGACAASSPTAISPEPTAISPEPTAISPEAGPVRADDATPAADQEATPDAVAMAGEAVSTAATPPTPAAWQRTDLIATTGPLAHVTDVLITTDQRVVVGYYDRDGNAGVAIREGAGGPWLTELLSGARQVRDIVELSNGALLATGTGARDGAILWRNDGTGWRPMAQGQLPRPDATNGWDLLITDGGAVLLATDSLGNDPDRAHESVHRSTDGGRTWNALSPIPGLGVLALAEAADGTLVAATAESDEHDDPAAAGQARVYTSADGGETWTPPSEPPGANRVYVLTVLSDGAIWAGTGIGGELLESLDGGRTWRALTHVPTSTKTVGEGDSAEVVTLEATRVYAILELTDGRIVVGTGNQAGDVFITDDRGHSWTPLPETGSNNVVWGLAQSADGILWIGTGSTTGDLLVSHVN